jgi:predicted GTPase
MRFGAGILAAERWGAEVIDPKPFAVGEIAETFDKYPDTGPVLPAMGYGEQQMADLKATIDAVDCELVVIGTPIDLTRIIDLGKPSVRVRYEFEALSKPDLADVLAPIIKRARG